MFGSWAGTALLVCSFAAGIGTIGLIGYLTRHRGQPGATWFLFALGGSVVWTLSYAVGLLIADPLLREYLEALMWVGMIWTGPLFLAFALDYTGRGNVLRGPIFPVLLVVPVVGTLLALTHQYHTVLWAGFEPVLTFEVATVLYSIQPVGYVAILYGTTLAGVAALLLVETIVSYGPLYRREATAVLLSAVPPAAGLLLWLSGIGPYPEVNLAPALFLLHVILDAYAFVGTNMFDRDPTAKRAVERTAIDDLPSPIVIVDSDRRIIDSNSQATALLGQDQSVGDVLELDAAIDLSAPAAENTAHQIGDAGRYYTVSTSPLVEPGGRTVGQTVVFQDVTDQRAREQQLNVLNRVLRHNLRSELTVMMGMAELLEPTADTAEEQEYLDTLTESGDALLDIVGRAREFDRIRGRERVTADVNVAEQLQTTVEQVRSDDDTAIQIGALEERTLHTDPELLGIVLTNLLSNAVEHNNSPSPTVTVSTAVTSTHYLITIDDDGPGIPEAELEVIRRGVENALEHGSGLGLWISTWGVEQLGGELTFDTAQTGTTVTIQLPLDETAPTADSGTATDTDSPDTGVATQQASDPRQSKRSTAAKSIED